MAISAKQVSELRAKTGAGIMDCKRALVECDGDITKAEEYLQKKSLAAAGKLADHVTAEGMAIFTIFICGYGAEMYLGRVTDEIYEFWAESDNEVSIENHVCNPYHDNGGENPVTDEDDNRWLGYWWEQGNVASTGGAYLYGLYVEVKDEDGNVVWRTEEIDDLDDHKKVFTEGTLEPGYYIHAYQDEKGRILSGKFEADEFEPDNLTFNGTQIMSHTLVDTAHYNGKRINLEACDATTKGFEAELIKVE